MTDPYNSYTAHMPAADQIVIESRLLIAQGRWNEARATVLAGLEQAPDSADAHFLMGQIYEHESDWQRAASEYRAGYNCQSR